MSLDIFKELNSEQRKAVEAVFGPSIILAGAGSGKTRVLVSKVINLILHHKVNPQSIVMITFTNKAAYEMKERIYKRTKEKLGYVGTFHSFCARLLRREGHHLGLSNDFVIYDEDDQLSLIKKIIKESNFRRKISPSYLLKRISLAKNQGIEPETYIKVFNDFLAEEVSQVFENYQKILRKNQALDFDDLLVETINLFKKNKKILDKYQNKYRFFLVDEFQDVNYIQYQLVKILSKKEKNITVVGDFSQSIYSWRGAEIENLSRFREDFPTPNTFYLERNYRSTQPILDFAYQVISKNQTHPILNLYTEKNNGNPVNFYEGENEEDEAFFIADQLEQLRKDYPPKKMAVLYRTNAQSRVIEEVFLHRGLPYILIGGIRFYERKEIKDILSFLRLVVNPSDIISLERIKKLGKKRWEKFMKVLKNKKEEFIKLSTNELIEKIFEISDYLSLYHPDDDEDYSRLENIRELKSVAVNYPKLVSFLEQVALVESEYFEDEKKKRDDGENRIKLMTIHQAKGLEFDVVFIIGLEEGILPHSKSLDDTYAIEEERRLFYVAITRAKELLYVTHAKKRFIFGNNNRTTVSRFLENIDN